MSIDDRIRAATQATAATVREIRPLTFPDDLSAPAPAVRPRRRRSSRTGPGRGTRPAQRGRPNWGSWLIPLAAAAAVIVLAAILVAVRDIPGGHPVPRDTGPAAITPVHPVAGVPRYAVFINEGANNRQGDLTVVDTWTGQPLATLDPPAHEAFNGVTGAADDRTFVVDVVQKPLVSPFASRSWYLLRITPGSAHPVSLTPLPIQGPSNEALIYGLALSPNGRTLAVLYAGNADGAPPNSNGPQQDSVLRTYSVATGDMLGSWNAPGPQLVHGVIDVNDSNDNGAGLTWLANGIDLAFTYPGQAIRLLDTTRSGTSLMAASHVVFALPAAAAGTVPCAQALLTPDGRTVLCGSAPNEESCEESALQFAVYSAATGKLEHLYRYTGKCSPGDAGDAQLVWVGSANEAIVQLQILAPPTPGSKQGFVTTRLIGLLTPGKLVPLHFPAVPWGSGLGLIAF